MIHSAVEYNTLFSLVLLPVAIFFARIMDVSIGTIRVIFVSRGMRVVAPILGFFEVLIWIIAVGQIMKNLNEWYYYVAYASGFAAGTWVGIWIEGKLAVGMVILRIITHTDATELTSRLRELNYGLTGVDAEGARGPVKILFMLLPRHDLKAIIKQIQSYNPNAFYSVEDVRFVREGIFPPSMNRVPLPFHLQKRISKKK
ncbi:MAG: DUF2179 domain-containing protein [bacterium]